MKEVRYAPHLELRLKLRGLPRGLPKKIYATSKERYFDKATQKFIAVQRARYRGKIREMIVVYEEGPTGIDLITIHPLKTYQKMSRIKIGRWERV